MTGKMKGFRWLLILVFFSRLSFAQESVKLLKDLIRIRTVNPPGNEIEAARYIARKLKRVGVPYKIYEPQPGRGSIVARWKGESNEAPICLLGHLDVVEVGEGWEVDPFAGVEKDGYIWGRGAVDMKGMVAMELAAFLRLAREAGKPKQDILFIATADEETGGKWGVDYLLQNEYDQVRCKFVWNEGAEGLLFLNTKIFPIQVGEKSVFWVKLTAHGRSGHGSVPHEDNPVQMLIEAIHRVLQMPRPVKATPAMRRMFDALFSEIPLLKNLVADPFTPEGFQKVYDLLKQTDPEMADYFYALTHTTVSPTVFQAGYQHNVIPEKAKARLDIRLLPGEDPEEYREKLIGAIGDPRVEVEVVLQSFSPETPTDTSFYRVLKKVIKRFHPDALVLPTLSAGGSDSRFYRAKGSYAYGLIPVFLEPSVRNTLHSRNERIPVSELVKGEKIIYEVLKEIAY